MRPGWSNPAGSLFVIRWWMNPFPSPGILPRFLALAWCVHWLACCNALSQEVSASEGWQRALPGWKYQFPRDHFDHPEFKTEWWYVTGHLRSGNDGKRELGFQVTFFRQGVRPPGQRREVPSRFVRDHFYFGHFAVSDLSRGKFRFGQKLSRGAFDEAGTAAAGERGDVLVWLEDCALTLGEDGSFHSVSSIDAGKVSLDLKLVPLKPLVFHGIDGASQKAEGTGNASHYYSITRMQAVGTLLLDGETMKVDGLAWMDREWASNQLADDQVGWDWFSLQFTDGSELMLYQLRKRDGTADPVSSATWIAADGTSTHLTSEAFSLTPVGNRWSSPDSGATYPLRWRIVVPSLGIDLTTTPRLAAQEMLLPPLTYWEGSIAVAGSHSGQGYMELTGYGGTVSPLTGTR